LIFRENISYRGLKQLAQLKKVEQFSVHTALIEDLDIIEVKSEVLQAMPWIKRLQEEIDIFDNSFCDTSFPVNLSISGEFQLEELFANRDLPQGATFPKLKKLLFCGALLHRRTLHVLEQCEHLESLYLLQISVNHVSFFVRVLGVKLRELALIEVDDVDLAEIFHYCPNLSKFEYFPGRNGLVGHNTKFSSKLSDQNFRLLKFFKSTCPSFSIWLPPGFFKYILHAPLIEHIELYDAFLRPGDVQAAHELRNENLKHLKVFELYDIKNCEVLFLDDLVSFVKHIICCAPKLEAFILTFDKEHDLYRKFNEREDVKYFRRISGLRSF
jgi:hypothetical protein